MSPPGTGLKDGPEDQPRILRLDDDFSFIGHPFTKRFSQALHAILVACPREDVFAYFADFEPRHREYLYKVFTLTVGQIHENALAEFGSICEETQVLEALDYISTTEFLSATEISPSAPPKDVVREAIVKKKSEEVDTMRNTLQQVKEENIRISAQLEDLRAKVGEARDLRSVDAVIDKVRRMNMMLAEVM